MNAETIAAKHEIDLAYNTLGGSDDSGSGTSPGSGTNIWSSNGFWGAVNNLIGSFGSLFGRPNYGAYPAQQQQPTVNPAIVYGGIGLLLLISLALVYKIIH